MNLYPLPITSQHRIAYRVLCHGNHIEPPSVSRAKSKTLTYHITITLIIKTNKQGLSRGQAAGLLFTSCQQPCTLHKWTLISNQDSDPKIMVSIIQLHRRRIPAPPQPTSKSVQLTVMRRSPSLSYLQQPQNSKTYFWHLKSSACALTGSSRQATRLHGI